MKDYRNVALLFITGVATVNALLSVQVYYEAINGQNYPFTHFISKQLIPTFKAFNTPNQQEEMTVKVVPYGNSFKQSQLENGTWEIRCDHNQYECYYNKIHACAIERYNQPNNPAYVRTWRVLNYINCLVTTNTHYTPNSCAVKTCFDDLPMPDCVNSVDGDMLLVKHGLETEALGIFNSNFLPIVTFDGVYREDEQKWARDHLLSLACNKTNNLPKVCSSPRAKAIMTHNNFGTSNYYPTVIGCNYN